MSPSPEEEKGHLQHMLCCVFSGEHLVLHGDLQGPLGNVLCVQTLLAELNHQHKACGDQSSSDPPYGAWTRESFRISQQK